MFQAMKRNHKSDVKRHFVTFGFGHWLGVTKWQVGVDRNYIYVIGKFVMKQKLCLLEV